MNESEAVTWKKRIDLKLKSSLLNWTIINNDKVKDTSKLNRHAVEEYQTETGPADYALFVDGKLLGIIEAKKIAVGAENVLEQAKRYSKSVPNTIGQWREYKVPFLYSTNGELIFHLDVRRKKNSSYEILDFHSPQAMLDRFNRNTQAEEAFESSSFYAMLHYEPEGELKESSTIKDFLIVEQEGTKEENANRFFIILMQLY